MNGKLLDHISQPVVEKGIYLDDLGSPVDGYVVKFRYLDGTGNEQLYVAQNDPATVMAAIKVAVNQHLELQNLFKT